MAEAGFYTVDACDEYAYIHLDHWDQSSACKAYGSSILEKVRTKGWYSHTLDIQFDYRKFLIINKCEIQDFIRWIQYRLGDKVASLIDPFKKE